MKETQLLFLTALLLLLLAVWFLWRAQRERMTGGLPWGRIIYDDSGARRRTLERALFDSALGLAGRPDYLLEQKGTLIPVELKSSNAPDQPYENHVMQLTAYCYLVEKSLHCRPPYGIIRYRNRSFAVDYTPELEETFLDLIEEMRDCERDSDYDRSHNAPGRCLRCGYRRMCDQRLS